MLDAFLGLLTVNSFLAMLSGLVMGITFGAIPGLTSTLALSLLVPVSFGMDPKFAMLLMLGSYCGAEYGGSISAILLGIPGTPAAAATKIDGYPMKEKGLAWEALRMSAFASSLGGIFSTVVLLIGGPLLAKFALNFGPPEFFSVGIMGLTIIASLDEKSMAKAFASGALGVFIATIGMDVVSGYPRFVFGNTSLMAGLELVPTLVGLFALPEIFLMFGEKNKSVRVTENLVGKYFPPMKEIKKCATTILRGSVIGTIIGIIPGTGSAISCFMAWNETKRVSKNPEKFGTGVIEGVAAPESSNNAITGGTLIPTLSLGIPGNSSTAILLGALMLHNLIPGPRIFLDQPVLTWSIMLGLFIINVMMYFVAMFGLRFFIKVLQVPKGIIAPVITTLVVIGSYSIRNNVFDIYTALAIGALAYFMKKGGFPVAPIVVALIVTPIIENSFRQSLIISNNGVLIFFTRPLSLILLLFSLFSLSYPFFVKYFNKINKNNQ